MDFRTIVPIAKGSFQIDPLEKMLFVGSCFADSIGQRFIEDKFQAVVNPFGTMYNPASILHTVERCDAAPRTAVFTLGTNHVYRLRETGNIVDNCEKRPARLFQEEELSVGECADYLNRAIGILRSRRSDVRVIITVSPIRYKKYGYHESQLSKAILLLAAETVCNANNDVVYFPAYEIMMDELRDYRFYSDDMLHPSHQAVEYIWQRFGDTYFSHATNDFLRQWLPIKADLAHRPFNPDSEEYKSFLASARKREKELLNSFQGKE